MTKQAKQAADILRARKPDFAPQLAIALGSGLGPLADEIRDVTVVPYDELPGFHCPHILGHGKNIYMGWLKDVPVMCFQGRAHYYEGVDNKAIQTMVRTARLLGCETWLATNSSGSLRADVVPGNLVVIRDHINMQFNNPLTGPNDEEFGPRFIGLEEVYSPELRGKLFVLADKLHIPLVDGVYIGVLGPTFETPAEIQAFRVLGADVVGMSTIPEVIVAHHCGMEVVAVAVITNLAAGMSELKLSHEETLLGAKLGTENLVKLVEAFVEEF
jgi:xanthosine phosphorylase